MSGLGFLVLLFVLPETKGVPLEELGEIFGDDPETLAMLQAVNRGAPVAQDAGPVSDVKEHEEEKV